MSKWDSNGQKSYAISNVLKVNNVSYGNIIIILLNPKNHSLEIRPKSMPMLLEYEP